MSAVTPATQPTKSQQGVVEAALVLLERMGLSPADLVATPRDRAVVPTFAEYVPVVSAAVSAGTRRAYGSYWNRIVEHWGTRRLDEPTASDIRQLMTWVKTHVVARRNARGGRSAQEHLVAALRCLYRRAVEDGLIAEADDPARKVAKPRRLPSTRRAVPETRLAEINQVAATTGDDPELDTLLLRLHTETACRRDGALALRPTDLDPDHCLILLREKGETVRWQPVSPTLMARLVRHGQERHAPDGGQLLRYADGRPVTSRRYDHLWARIGRQLPWVRTQQISTHWIRHTTLTWVERNFGYAGGPRLSGPHRVQRGRGRDVDLRPCQPVRGGRRPGRADRRTPSPGHAGRVVIPMVALTVAADRAASREAGTAGPASVRSAGPAAADRSGAGVRAEGAVRSWPLLVLAAPAAAEVWSGWVGIAQMTGFGLVRPLPGIWPSLHLDTAITLPIGVEAYTAYALRAWLARDTAISVRTRRFAQWSAICSFALGMAGQVAYHLMAQSGMTRAPWAITTVVSCLPVLVLGMGTALAYMLRADTETTRAPADGTRPPAALRSLSCSPEDQDRPDRTGPETDRHWSPSRDQIGETPGPQHGRRVTGPDFWAARPRWVRLASASSCSPRQPSHRPRRHGPVQRPRLRPVVRQHR
jgi:site-specific recombinase XerD